jgi:hypothetical protein
VTREEHLFLPEFHFPLEGCRELPLSDIAHAVACSSPTVLYEYDNELTHKLVTELLHFDPFHAIDDRTLQDILRHSESGDIVPSSTLSTVCSLIKKGCEVLAAFLSATHQMTYNQLYGELSQYSIFTDANLYVSLMVVVEYNGVCM